MPLEVAQANRDDPALNTLRAEIEVPTDEKGVSMVFPRAQELPFPGLLASLEKATFQYSGKAKPNLSAVAVLQDVDLVIHVSTGSALSVSTAAERRLSSIY